MSDLSGRVAVVTGAGTGIGVGIARRLAEHEARVIVSASSSFEGAERLAAELRGQGADVRAVRSDFRRAANAAHVVEEALDAFGQVDILVNNAGRTMVKPFADCDEQDWDDLFNVNIKSMFVTCQAALPGMLERGFGRIINISSVHSQVHAPGYVIYSATKGAINEFTRNLAIDIGRDNITANVIAPGAIHVERYDRENVDESNMIRGIPSASVGTPADIAGAAAFLASEDARYVNGAVLFVDGGLTARMSIE